jgi:hypothetical protein
MFRLKDKVKVLYDNLYNKIGFVQNDVKTYNSDNLKNPKVILGRMLSGLNKDKKITSLHEVEFQVFSQWGDDGIIQYLINNIDLPNKTFVEFGVENYRESNTRFLIINDNWTGLVIDGSTDNIDYIKRDGISWSNELYAKDSFITKENINELLSNLPFGQELGILSVDIDGNDYWIWKEISVVNPVIVIAEYNSVFGIDNAWSLPYKADFVRPSDNKNPLHIFYGSSLLSLCDLAKEKGYSFIGCNSYGNNAYFIRNDKLGDFKEIAPKDGFIVSKFRECINPDGSRLSAQDRRKSFSGREIYNTRTKSLEIIP